MCFDAIFLNLGSIGISIALVFHYSILRSQTTSYQLLLYSITVYWDHKLHHINCSCIPLQYIEITNYITPIALVFHYSILRSQTTSHQLLLYSITVYWDHKLHHTSCSCIPLQYIEITNYIISIALVFHYSILRSQTTSHQLLLYSITVYWDHKLHHINCSCIPLQYIEITNYIISIALVFHYSILRSQTTSYQLLLYSITVYWDHKLHHINCSCIPLQYIEITNYIISIALVFHYSILRSQTTSHQLLLYSITVYWDHKLHHINCSCIPLQYISVIYPWLSIGVGFINHIWLAVYRQPLWKIMDWVRQLGPDDIPFPIWWESHSKWFQSPPTRSHNCHHKLDDHLTISDDSGLMEFPRVTFFLSKRRWNLSFIMIQIFKKIEKWWSWTWLIVIKIIYDKSE